MIQDTDTVHVRCGVDDVPVAVQFYTTHLGFAVLTDFGPAFADVKRGNLRWVGVSFRSDVVTGPAGKQTALDDPSGNPIELFQPAAG